MKPGLSDCGVPRILLEKGGCMFNSGHSFANSDDELSEVDQVIPQTAYVSNHLELGLFWRSTCRRDYATSPERTAEKA